MIDLSDPDPSPDVLTERMGFFEERMGAVQLLRNELPQIGHWYRATKGFLFLPHELRNVVDEETNWKPQSSVGDWWSLIKSMMPQAALIDWLTHRFNENHWNDALLTPPEIDTQTPQLLARLLMRHPGVLFIEHTTISQYRNRKRNWTLYRSPARTIHLRVLGEWREFQERMESTLKFTHPGSAPVEML
ncbi:MAG: hypothetical protein CMJ46_01025 [Planctomyces sp.]|nr:hypothetical protein [Planctomyces sp.]